MNICYQADADLNQAIIEGVKHSEVLAIAPVEKPGFLPKFPY